MHTKFVCVTKITAKVISIRYPLWHWLKLACLLITVPAVQVLIEEYFYAAIVITLRVQAQSVRV